MRRACMRPPVDRTTQDKLAVVSNERAIRGAGGQPPGAVTCVLNPPNGQPTAHRSLPRVRTTVAPGPQRSRATCSLRSSRSRPRFLTRTATRRPSPSRLVRARARVTRVSRVEFYHRADPPGPSATGLRIPVGPALLRRRGSARGNHLGGARPPAVLFQGGRLQHCWQLEPCTAPPRSTERSRARWLTRFKHTARFSQPERRSATAQRPCC